MKLIHNETKATLTKAAKQMKTQYDKKKKATVEYQIGDKVWLDTTNLHLTRPKKKLNDKCVSPFVIIEKCGLSAYKLKLLPIWKIYPVFNETLLTPYVAPTFPNQKRDPPPPPDIINNEEQYEIETILDHKTHKVRGSKDPKTGKYTTNIVTDYLVAWKGYRTEENKWTKESELGYAQEAIAKYWEGREDTITVQAIVIDKEKIIVISDAIKADDGWKYLVKKPQTLSYWYFEDKIPELENLIDDYWYANDQECLGGLTASEGHYKLLDENGKIFISRDVIFEEGLPHRTVSVVGETEPNGDLFPDPDVQKELFELPDMSTTENNKNNVVPDVPENQEPNQANEPPPLHRSARLGTSTQAAAESREYQQSEDHARSMGEDWAAIAQMRKLGMDLNEYITFLTDTKASHHIPKTYNEAM
ncbi:uncharacterized protein ARMOST_19809 [Armillaria ostoyae]|uniref:Chromo domain-containing protein n=1 Tax=Armillaria ostoyae TaxID=47428 RepID=A0A284S5L4_ARMOS|nr:uncharacterized protein ARMOST_19809 [Armillaria ostoyae]